MGIAVKYPIDQRKPVCSVSFVLAPCTVAGCSIFIWRGLRVESAPLGCKKTHDFWTMDRCGLRFAVGACAARLWGNKKTKQGRVLRPCFVVIVVVHPNLPSCV